MDDILKKEILDTLKTEGLDIAEDMAVTAVRSAFTLLRLLVPKLSIIGGEMMVGVLAVLEPKVLALLDKIDGVDDPEY